MEINEVLAEVLDEHLNDGCIDSRCWFDVVDEDGEPDVHFPDEFLEHLSEALIEALDC